MPYPVPPPEPPPIIQVSQPEDVTSSIPALRAIPTSNSASTLAAGVLTTPTAPEAFTPETSSPESIDDDRAAITEAALLGPTIAVGFSVTVTSDTVTSDTVISELAVSRQDFQTKADNPSSAPAPAPSTSSQLPSLTPAVPLPEQQEEIPSPGVLQHRRNAVGQDATEPETVEQQAPTDQPDLGNRNNNREQSREQNPRDTVPPDPVTVEQNSVENEGFVDDEDTDSGPPSTPPPTDPRTTSPTSPRSPTDVIELTADRQEYDDRRRVFSAEGNVIMRFRGSVLDTDRLQVNLPNRIAVAEGNAALTRGEQVLRGDRFEYNFVQEEGTIFNASGEVFLPTSGADFSPTLPTDVSAANNRPLSDRITANQPLQGVSSSGGVTIDVGGGSPGQRGEVRRIRFEAERIDFNAEGWQASNIRLTNDPFSPPELELRADDATFTRISPERSEIRASRPRLVFDQGLSVPLLRSRAVIDRRERDPGLISFGYDGEDRGGLFAEATFEPINTERFRFSIRPQFLIQRAVNESEFFSPDSFGLIARLNANPGPRTSIEGTAVFTSLDLTDVENQLRASLRARQLVGTHTLNLEYSYRDRLFNGSLGFQDIQSSLGAVLISPVIPLGNTGINLSYQVGAQYVNADTDRLDLLDPIRRNNRVSLGRAEASAALNRGFLLWQGSPLPATANEGLRYTPAPVVPYLQLFTGLRGVIGAYSNGDTQEALTGTIGIQGQVGHFSRSFLDYTGFNISYSKTLDGGQSPFLFDRIVDTEVLSGGIVQQIYGPIRIGLQTSISLNRSREINTDYFIEYSRRTYGLVLRYNPVQSLGSLSLRISDFNWNGGTERFSGAGGVRPVTGGVIQSDD